MSYNYQRFEVRIWDHVRNQMLHKPFNAPLNSIISHVAFTAMQCTGMKDKYGKIIWENDILEFHPGIPEGEIYYSAGAWRLGGYPVTENDGAEPTGYLASMLAVVGNVYMPPQHFASRRRQT